MNTSVEKVLVALISPGIALSNKLAVASELSARFAKEYDGEPSLMPLPEDAPPEFPRIILNSKDGQDTLTVSRTRVEISTAPKPGSPMLFPPTIVPVVAIGVWDVLSRLCSAQFSRIGVLVDWLGEAQEGSPTALLGRSYIHGATPLEGAKSLEIASLHKGIIGRHETNEWIRMILNAGDDLESTKVSIRVDINTRADKNYLLDKDGVELFIRDSFTANGRKVAAVAESIGVHS